LLSPLLLAASAPAPPQARTLDQALKDARAEQALAEAQTVQLERTAAAARGKAEQLHAQQAAAAQAIEAAEARITVADTQYRLASAHVAAQEQRLARAQQPVASLLAGLAVMARRPPILAIVGGGGTDELVKVGVLLDSTLPVIQKRTHALSAQLSQTQQLEGAAASARAELIRSHHELALKREQFAALEQRAIDRSLAAGGEALSAGDVAIASGEQIERIHAEQASSQAARALASSLEDEGPAPQRPFAPAGPQPKPPFPYALPVHAPVIEGLGAVNDSGVRSRGVHFVTGRGAQLSVPADGIVRFSGPFRAYDGIVIIDHGGGWVSLIVNLSSPLKPGDKVRLGDPLGRALGPLDVELWHNGRRFSPALIAGSSQTLSMNSKDG
jgi:septal ring factor EnvC (AmiA/AmiB activator)